MRKLWPYIFPPMVALSVIFILTIAFQLISAPSDIKVFIGCVIAVIAFAIIYKSIVKLITQNK